MTVSALNSEIDRPPLLTLVAAGALAAGLGELFARFVVRQWSVYLDKSFYLDPQSVWMGPIASVPAMMVVVGGAWVLAGRLRNQSLRFALPLGAMLSLAVFQVLLTTTRVHPAALAALALGATSPLVRIALQRRLQAARLLGRSALILAVISVVGGIGWNVWIGAREELARRRLGPVHAGAPNVLLLILDTVRASQLSAYGYHRPTSPFLARLASEGMRFDRAITTAPWTLPSHASIFTGHYPRELGVGWNQPLGPQAPTIAERFSAGGYVTGGFVANTIYGTWLHGLSRGFQRYADYPISVSQMVGSSNINRRILVWANRTLHQYWTIGHKDAKDVNREFLAWIDRRPAERPFFAFLNYFDAHMPYRPPPPWRTMYMDREPVTRDINNAPRIRPTPEIITGLRDAYDGAITYLDTQLDSLFTELTRRGLRENTIVVVTADHGEAFGEHGFLSHGSSTYLPEVHVPLLIDVPGTPASACATNRWVTLRDLPATLVKAAGLPGPTGFPGRSLLTCDASADSMASPVLVQSDERDHLPEWYPAAAGALESVILGDVHVMRIADSYRVFDLAKDPAELRDVSGDSSYQAILREAQRLLETSRRSPR
jgi:arylsulfatase A-like enzyme